MLGMSEHSLVEHVDTLLWGSSWYLVHVIASSVKCLPRRECDGC